MNENLKKQLGDWWPVLKPIFNSQQFVALRCLRLNTLVTGVTPLRVMYSGFRAHAVSDLKVVILDKTLTIMVLLLV